MKLQTTLILSASALALSIASFDVVMQGASDEPYTAFRKWDALVQVGGATMFMLLWLQLSGVLMAGVLQGHVSKRWLLLLLWIALCEFYLFHSISGYVEDITRYVAHS